MSILLSEQKHQEDHVLFILVSAECMEADEISMNICYLNEYVDTDEWIVH